MRKEKGYSQSFALFVLFNFEIFRYALKRLLAADREANEAILQEICFLKKLSGLITER